MEELQKDKIIACGNEEFTLGFELVGIQAKPISEIEKLIKKNSQIGVIIIDKQDYETLNLKLKNQITKLIKPIVVILSKEDIKGGNLKKAVIKAFGVDLLK